ncbi:hypothetical protein ACO0LB_16085 [Undibacterium sp. SXout7W]|uniref:hypothetical protein n=1 Tax=Undibacterium sp. SXout7W TaxID=3413049 RepID=UPI003BF2FB3F
MKPFPVSCSVAVCLLFVAGSVLAEGGRGPSGGNGGNAGGFFGRSSVDLQRRDDLVRSRRDVDVIGPQGIGNSRSVEQRCADDQHAGDRLCGGNDNAQKKSRLTLDERRALRRQIQDAGQELYIPVK